MSLKCSIFGHDFADPEVEREREEQGSEVVITITETETCQRCGEQRVVSENKEVTSLETPSDIVGDDLVDESSEDDEEAEFIEEAPGEPEVPTPETEETDPPEDDAVILDDEDDEDEPARSPGEWPDEEESAPEQPAEAGADADTLEERPPGEWPDDGRGQPDSDWAPDIEPAEETPAVEPTEDAITVPEGEFYCPECGFTTPVESSSLREGDFCPECHRGTLSQRVDES